MNVYLNKKEMEAISNADAEVCSRLECCDDKESIKHLREIIKRLRAIENKYYKT